MLCYDQQELEALLHGELPAAQERRVRKHLDVCRRCGEHLSELAENLRLLDSLQSLLDHQEAADDETPQVPETIGDYRIVHEIGRGGMGIVYAAEQRHPRRQVALKVLFGGPTADKYRVRLFRREAQALARLRHPCIAGIYSAGQTSDGQHYLVMELVQGMSLDRYVREAQLSTRARLELFRRICKAINYAHQHGVIHLDVKPSNMLVDADGHPKVLDFGLARIIDPDTTMTVSVTDVGKIQGTLPYMSPEQLHGDPGHVDLRSDVYSLGVILYELLTERLPHDIDQRMRRGAVHQLCESPPRRPSTINRTLRGDLETIILKALEKDPARRYQSALALAEDLERYWAGQPILARPASSFYQFRKLVTRNKAPFAVAAAFVLLVMGFGVWMSALYARAQQAERLAQQRLHEADKSRADLEVVAKFQDDMLSSIGAQEFGQEALVRLRQAIQDALEDAGVTPASIEELLGGLDESLAHVNRPDFGRELLHEGVLSRASGAIAKEFADRPLIEAQLRSTIGGVYHSLGDYERAEPHLSAASKIRVRELGRDHPETLQAFAGLAALYRDQGRYDEAEPLLVETLATRQRVLPSENAETLGCMRELAVLFTSQGRYDEAESLLVNAVELSSQADGREHPATLRYLDDLGVVYTSQARYNEAEQSHSEVLDGARRTLGDEHPDTQKYMNSLAVLYERQGRYDEARALYETVLELRRRTLGCEHPDTVTSLFNLAALHGAQHQYELAERLFLKALAFRQHILGKKHPSTLSATTSLGMLYKELGRNPEAESLCAEALAGGREVLGGKHPSTLTFMANLGSVYLNQDRLEEAEQLFRNASDISREVNGSEHPATLQYMAELALVHIYTERGTEAEAMYKQIVDASRRAVGDEHPQTVLARHNLLMLLQSLKRYDEAEPLAVINVAVARKSMHDNDWHKAVYLGVYGKILLDLERYAEAEPVLLDARRIFERTLGPENRVTRRTAELLARVHCHLEEAGKVVGHRTLLPPA